MSRHRYLTGLLLAFVCALSHAAQAQRPNVVLVITDDQGVGDFSFMDNPILKTPHIDRLADEGICMNRFYVSSVCAPTRASLMTGRYNYRTRVVDTFVGRAMMEPDELTVAEVLHDAGYATGLFGKWHLGDNYPLRPQDQGFDEVLMLRGGGIGQPGDPVGGEGKYTDAILFHNGKQVQTKGYCTDVYFDAAMEWIESSHRAKQPFFAYVATNTPHQPFHDVPEDLYQQFKKMDLTPLLKAEYPEKRKATELDNLARILAMIVNIDDNVGRMYKRLDDMKILDNTIFIFLTDNGPNTMRYVGNLRGMKSDVNEGGIRTPLLVRWPEHIKAHSNNDTVTAHIDIMPTLLAACGVELPKDSNIDGRNMLPLWLGEKVDWPERTLYTQAHRGNEPMRYHNCAAIGARYKLVHPSGFHLESFEGEPAFELYDIEADPGEMHNLAKAKPKIVEQMKRDYDRWFDDVSSTRKPNYAPPRIIIDPEHEPVTTLTRQDWRHQQGRPWAKDSNGVWLLSIAKPVTCRVDLRFPTIPSDGTLRVRFDDGSHSIDRLTRKIAVKRGSKTATIEGIKLDQCAYSLQTILSYDDVNKGVWQVDITAQD